MKRVSLKLLVLYGIVCGIFFATQSGFCATSNGKTQNINKSSSFSTKLSQQSDNSTSSSSAIAEKIREQRAALDARDKQNTTSNAIKSGASNNSCDNTLRKCIESRCGSNYMKCATDSDITFSDKLNACKKSANCTAHEFTLFSNEFKQDKKQAVDLFLYNQVIDCGTRYKECITNECGYKFGKCLGKSAGDKALEKCKKIASECTEADSALPSRMGTIFGIVRQNAEKQIKTQEQELLELRKKMKSVCETWGAMFDERSLTCVFSVTFSAGEKDSAIKTSKKLYADQMFDCTPDWFGIDVTTFKENAFRATRAQKAASAAAFGAGLGTAAGAYTSGAIDRAIDTKKAKDALKDACSEQGQVLDSKTGKCREMTDKEKQAEQDKLNREADAEAKKQEREEEREAKKQAKADKKQAEQQAKETCEENGLGRYRNGKCTCKNDLAELTSDGTKCEMPADNNDDEEPEACLPNELDTLHAIAGEKRPGGKCVPTVCNAQNNYVLVGQECIKKTSGEYTPSFSKADKLKKDLEKNMPDFDKLIKTKSGIK